MMLRHICCGQGDLQTQVAPPCSEQGWLEISSMNRTSYINTPLFVVVIIFKVCHPLYLIMLVLPFSMKYLPAWR